MFWKEKRKDKGKHKTNELSVDDLYVQFKNLFSENDLYTNADVKNHLND